MTSARPSVSTLVLFLTLLVSPVVCRAPRKLLQTPVVRITGKAIVIEQDRPGEPVDSVLAVHITDGPRVQVDYTDPSQIDGIYTGMDIELTGQWEVQEDMQQQDPTEQSTTDDTAQAASTGTPFKPRPNKFVARRVRVTALPKKARAPKLTTTKIRAATTSGIVSSAATSTSTLSTNTLITPEVSAIIIPIVGTTDPRNSDAPLCPGLKPPMATVTDIRNAVFQELNPAGHTVGSTFNECSYGKTRLTTNSSRVANPIVRLPCSGTSDDGKAWAFRKCELFDLIGYADAADRVIRSRGTNLDAFDYKVYLVPPGVCDFTGLGYVGCNGQYECRAWISGDLWTSPQAIVHELGHNLFMGHAGALVGGQIDEYADASCVMGYCCHDRCFNTPHSWQMGWIQVQQLDGSTLRPGTTVTMQVNSQATNSSRAGLRIVTGWVPNADQIYVGYRTRAGGDDILIDEVANKVHVYTANITNTWDPKKTMWRGQLTVGQAWEHAASGVVVRFRAAARGVASVSVCRDGGAETLTSCQNNIDKDCNGLTGLNDPACAALLRRAAL